MNNRQKAKRKAAKHKYGGSPYVINVVLNAIETNRHNLRDLLLKPSDESACK